MTIPLSRLACSASARAWRPSRASQTVNLYTSREPGLIKPVLMSSPGTGVKVNIVFAQNGLEERIAAVGANSPPTCC